MAAYPCKTTGQGRLTAGSCQMLCLLTSVHDHAQQQLPVPACPFQHAMSGCPNQPGSLVLQASCLCVLPRQRPLCALTLAMTMPPCGAQRGWQRMLSPPHHPRTSSTPAAAASKSPISTRPTSNRRTPHRHLRRPQCKREGKPLPRCHPLWHQAHTGVSHGRL